MVVPGSKPHRLRPWRSGIAWILPAIVGFAIGRSVPGLFGAVADLAAAGWTITLIAIGCRDLRSPLDDPDSDGEA